jgi:hypothetical protein
MIKIKIKYRNKGKIENKLDWRKSGREKENKNKNKGKSRGENVLRGDDPRGQREQQPLVISPTQISAHHQY